MAKSLYKPRKSFNATAQVVCVQRDGWRTSYGLTTVSDIKASTKKGAEQIARRTWHIRGELPVKRPKYRSSCKIHTSVEEV